MDIKEKYEKDGRFQSRKSFMEYKWDLDDLEIQKELIDKEINQIDSHIKYLEAVIKHFSKNPKKKEYEFEYQEQPEVINTKAKVQVLKLENELFKDKMNFYLQKGKKSFLDSDECKNIAKKNGLEKKKEQKKIEERYKNGKK
ncbi:MAG: hypothetical protein ACQESN_11005 [Thermotogota bacterium]